jgi:hypothetical protein
MFRSNFYHGRATSPTIKRLQDRRLDKMAIRSGNFVSCFPSMPTGGTPSDAIRALKCTQWTPSSNLVMELIVQDFKEPRRPIHKSKHTQLINAPHISPAYPYHRHLHCDAILHIDAHHLVQIVLKASLVDIQGRRSNGVYKPFSPSNSIPWHWQVITISRTTYLSTCFLMDGHKLDVSVNYTYADMSRVFQFTPMGRGHYRAHFSESWPGTRQIIDVIICCFQSPYVGQRSCTVLPSSMSSTSENIRIVWQTHVQYVPNAVYVFAFEVLHLSSWVLFKKNSVTRYCIYLLSGLK